MIVRVISLLLAVTDCVRRYFSSLAKLLRSAWYAQLFDFALISAGCFLANYYVDGVFQCTDEVPMSFTIDRAIHKYRSRFGISRFKQYGKTAFLGFIDVVAECYNAETGRAFSPSDPFKVLASPSQLCFVDLRTKQTVH